MDHAALTELLDEMPTMVWILDAELRGTYVNDIARTFSGRPAQAQLGYGWQEMVHPDDLAGALALLRQHAAAGTICAFDARMRRGDGAWRIIHIRARPFFDDQGRFQGMLGVNADVTEARAHESELTRLVTHDKVTGLPNRALIQELLHNAIQQAASQGQTLPVLVFSADHFNRVNETFGFGAGNQLLEQIGRRLSALRQDGELIGHLAGNRFVLVPAPGDARSSLADAAARRLIGLCAEPFQLDRAPHHTTCSIGIARFPADADIAQELMRAAEAALFSAKQQSGNSIAYFDPDAHGQALDRFDMAVDLRLGIARGELLLHFQPKVALPDFALIGFEALVRWAHPQRGLLPPAEFIDLAEDSGLIGPLTHWVFDAVGRQIRAWIDAGLAPVPVAINVSPDEFLHGIMATHLPAFRAYGLPENLLEIEITESTVINDFGRVFGIVEALRSTGITVAMDDFGTGYSSLASLNKLPISALKIDRTFTKDIDWDRACRAVASAILSIARELDLAVVAEGVETEAQLAVLRALDCRIIQGYLTGRPVPAPETFALLRPSCD